jgi:hypothetical protein
MAPLTPRWNAKEKWEANADAPSSHDSEGDCVGERVRGVHRDGDVDGATVLRAPHRCAHHAGPVHRCGKPVVASAKPVMRRRIVSAYACTNKHATLPVRCDVNTQCAYGLARCCCADHAPGSGRLRLDTMLKCKSSQRSLRRRKRAMLTTGDECSWAAAC